jgi:hypothetical protein
MVRDPPKVFIFVQRTDNAEPKDIYSLGRLCFRYNVDGGLGIAAVAAHPDQSPESHPFIMPAPKTHDQAPAAYL